MKRLINYLFILILVVPVLFLFIYAFTYNVEWPNITISNLRLDALNYFMSSTSTRVIPYSIYLSTVVALLTIVIVFLAAKLLAQYNYKYNNLIRVCFLIPFIVPITSISIGVYYQFLVLGLAGNSIGIVIIHLLSTIPYAIILIEKSIRQNNWKREVIAKQLGANNFTVFTKIIIPENINAIIITFLLSFTISFSQYFTTFIIGQGKIKTYAMEMYPYILNNDRHYGAMFNLVFIFCIVIVFIAIVSLIKVFYKYCFNYRIKDGL